MMSCARYFCIFGGDTNLNKEERSLFSMQFHPEGIQLEQGRAIPYLSTFLKLIYYKLHKYEIHISFIYGT